MDNKAKRKYIKLANELCYGSAVIEKIEKAVSVREIERILAAARLSNSK